MREGSSQILPVILCGGSGARLWPASRDSRPKPFLNLLGPYSTFQMAVQRVASPAIFSQPVIILSKAAKSAAADQLAQIGAGAAIILEPVQRDSAAAIAVAACHAASSDPEAILLIVPADHVIDDPEAFLMSCEAAIEPARQGHIMILGLVPQDPATGYGYIRPGIRIDGTAAFKVDSFIEKPDGFAAQGYIEQGYLWNSGIFMFRADVMLDELARFQPEILAGAREALQRATADQDSICLHEGSFGLAPKTSIDYAVMEHTDRAGVIPVSFSWSDIGTWEALWNASPRDERGNCLRGNVEVTETRNSLIDSNGILTTVAGLNDIVVVTRPDAVLVAARKRPDLVKDFVASLRAKQRPEASEPVRMDQSWGWYETMDRGSRFQVKRIVVKPGAGLSLQRHHHRAEHWVVLHGGAEVTVEGRTTLVREGEAAYIPVGAVHRLANPGRVSLEIIGIQIGSYTGEDDIIRVEGTCSR
ncbi:mannose-1-phosphate guanylyltransferase/mannose-6-phosphate isomerase [Microvirga sp. HBU67558]|uniref:mannose-1-phosphate guanylyltransferase/mannose-6-phosphate isomerase n=1 Tax=Microvirga TaxID=186650 RepID=UPI001B38BDF8|nr:MULTISPECIES: mannose-1-phosphate guanylyltransferase/mannose-6-phosphate isomerase [unclassified Microvirga]MBQ0823530.1 mannose-1-phosphate guanylyltransferase/mannose-6-phosphate isomerase [Microvirga sp. HBU67558]